MNIVACVLKKAHKKDINIIFLVLILLFVCNYIDHIAGIKFLFQLIVIVQRNYLLVCVSIKQFRRGRPLGIEKVKWVKGERV